MQPYGCLLADEPSDPFRALSDMTRRTILEELAQRKEQTLYELGTRLIMNHGIDMTRQAIRKHLAVLEDAGFVTTRQEGKYKQLAFTGSTQLADVQKWLDKIRRTMK